MNVCVRACVRAVSVRLLGGWMFRVFGSPFTLALHQHVTYLRLKQLPFKVYCTSLTTTLFYALVYGARNAFCCLTPNASSRLQVWQLAESAELDEDLHSITSEHGRDGEVQYVSADGKPLAPAQRMLVNKRTHPRLHLASWVTVVYSCWWLAKTGAMYRWVLGEDYDVVEGYLRFFTIVPMPSLAPTRTVAPKFREVMSRVTMVTGVSRETAPYMDEHFHRMCAALEEHFARQGPRQVFLLGTPHPTLADVTLSATFSSSFLTDDPPAALVAERYPNLVGYVERMTGWKGAVFVGDQTPLAAAAEGDGGRGSYPDVVPETLSDFFAVMVEVFPFMMSQCASFNAYMSSDAIRTLRRAPLEAPWEGCHGYLLPQMTAVKSLMTIDNSVCSVQARSQDLEVALLAAQEVMDDELDDFGRDLDRTHPPSVHTPPTHTSSEKESPPREAPSPLAAVEEEGAAGPAVVKAGVAAAAALVDLKDGVSSPPATAAPRGASRQEKGEPACCPSTEPDGQETDGDSCGSGTGPREGLFKLSPTNVDDPEDANFYRVFTKKGMRRFGLTALNRSFLEERRASDEADYPNSRDALTVSGSAVYRHLNVLRGMLGKMRSPQYTLASVFHGRRMYVAVIPEYEVAKLRAKRATEKRNASKRPMGVT